MRKKNAAILTMAIVMIFWSVGAYACTTILVTPGASVDGSASVTHTCDSGTCPYELVKVPAQDWEPGTMVDVLHLPQYCKGFQRHEIAATPTGNQIPQVEHTYGYILGTFGVINEKQVSIGENTTTMREESYNTNGYFEITNLSVLAMERAATAREAIQIMGSLGEKYGFKDWAEGLSVADPNECWVFEMVGPGTLWEQGDEEPGAYWVAQRVPDGHIAASANTPVIREIDFDDHENFMFTPGLLEYAIEQGWYDPESGEAFNWREHFCGLTYASKICDRRVWRVFCLVAPSLADTLDENSLPFSVPVDKKVSVADINNIQRDHFEDSQYDMRYTLAAGPYNNPRRYHGTYFKAERDGEMRWFVFQRPIATNACAYSITTQSRSWLPDEIGAVVWYGGGIPDLTCYVPMYASMPELSPCLNSKAGSKQNFTRDSYWWAIRSVNTYADLMYDCMSEYIYEWIDKYEGHAIRSQSAVEAAALELYQKDPQEAIDFLTVYCNRNVETVRDAWWELLDDMIWNYTRCNVLGAGPFKQEGMPLEWRNRYVEEETTDYFVY